MDEALAFLSVGCDKEGTSEFVFWLTPDEVTDKNKALQLQTQVGQLGDEGKKAVQAHWRNMVEAKLRVELAAIGDVFQATFPQAAQCWCKQGLYAVLAEVLSQESALNAFRTAFPESVTKSIMEGEEGQALVEFFATKGEESVSLVQSYIDLEFEAAIERSHPSMEAILRDGKTHGC